MENEEHKRIVSEMFFSTWTKKANLIYLNDFLVSRYSKNSSEPLFVGLVGMNQSGEPDNSSFIAVNPEITTLEKIAVGDLTATRLMYATQTIKQPESRIFSVKDYGVDESSYRNIEELFRKQRRLFMLLLWNGLLKSTHREAYAACFSLSPQQVLDIIKCGVSWNVAKILLQEKVPQKDWEQYVNYPVEWVETLIQNKN